MEQQAKTVESPPPSYYTAPGQQPPPGSPTTGPSPYPQYGQPYDQPVAGYPPHPGYGYYGAPAPPPPAPAPQQQPRSVTVICRRRIVHLKRLSSYSPHMMFACLLAWFCNPLFGIIAYVLAVMASSNQLANPAQAKQLGHASIGVSIAGIGVSILFIIIYVAVVASSDDSCYYTYGGDCFSSRSVVGSDESCTGVRSAYGDYCYYQ